MDQLDPHLTDEHDAPTSAVPRAGGEAFYDRGRDVVAYLLSGIAVAAIVWYVSLLVSWYVWLRGIA